MKALTLKHLRYLSALAQHGHFGRAAEACSISQPALSVQIRELEAMVAAPLVERGGREVHLTALGEEFVTRAQSILSAVDELGDITRNAAGGQSGPLRLGVIPTIAPYLLPQIAQTLMMTMPGIDLRPREAVTHALIADLLAHRLDAAILALPVQEPRLREMALFEEEFVLVRSLQDAREPVPSARNLSEMRLLLLEEGHCFRDQALTFCSPDGTRARDVMEGSSLSTLVQMVGAGLGLTLIPEMAVAYETRDSNVSISRFTTDVPKRTVGLVWRETYPLKDQMIDLAYLIRGLRP